MTDPLDLKALRALCESGDKIGATLELEIRDVLALLDRIEELEATQPPSPEQLGCPHDILRGGCGRIWCDACGEDIPESVWRKS